MEDKLIIGSGFFDVKYDYSNKTKNTLDQYGTQIIKRLRIMRKPLTAKIQYALKFATSNKSSQIYDTLFHLGLIATMDVRDLLIEKNEVIDIVDNFNFSGDMELLEVPLHNRQITLNELMNTTKDGMGDKKYFEYNAFTNNCQFFVNDILKYNTLLTNNMHVFLFQDLKEIIATTPKWAQSIANFVTHTAGWWNKVTGGNKPIFSTNIENSALQNDHFKKLLYTTFGNDFKLHVISLKPNFEIGDEIHHEKNQYFKIHKGKALLIYGNNDDEHILDDNDSVIIPAGLKHNIINIGNSNLKLYTTYAKI